MVLQAGAQAPDFTLAALDGKRHSLTEALKEGPVLAGFFKSSCPVCQFTFPFLDRFHRFFKDTKARVWAICQDEARDAREFVQEYELAMPVLLEDLDSYETSNAYGLTHVPSVFLIGQNGEVLQSTVGFQRQDLVQMGRRLELLTAKKGFVPFTEDDDVPNSRAG